MLSQQEQARYSKQIILPEIGMEGQERLKAAKVLVVGAGGLGCPILQYLTAAGIGTIGIVDGDVVSLSNLQRQVLYTENDLGEKKSIIAEKKLKQLNNNVLFNVFTEHLDVNNALDIISDYDLVIDGSDNFPTRYLINDACVILDKPFVSGAIYKFEGQLSVFNWQNGPTYRCIFPEPPADGESPNCADIGVVATLPGIIGTLQANEAIKIITQTGEVLSGKLLTMNVLDMNVHIFNCKLNPANKLITQLKTTAESCALQPEISQVEYTEVEAMLAKQHNIQLIDVREMEEHLIGNIGGVNIPLSQFETRYTELNATHPIVLYCASGTRSNHFAKQLQKKGYNQVFNLKNGINHLKMN